MSLLNAWVDPAAALVAVDTDGATLTGERFPVSKLVTLPHIGAVLALRGQAAFLGFLFLRCLTSGFDTFDDLDEAMPEMLAGMEATIPPELIVRTGIAGTELVTAGWSNAQGRVIGRQYVKRGDSEAFTVRDLGMHVSPWHESMKGLRTDADAVVTLAKAQTLFMKSAYDGAACGGSLLLCRVTRDGVTTGIRANLELEARAA